MDPSASFATFVFKIRIRDHPRNPRGKTLPADALAAKVQMPMPKRQKKLEIQTFNLGANNSRTRQMTKSGRFATNYQLPNTNYQLLNPFVSDSIIIAENISKAYR